MLRHQNRFEFSFSPSRSFLSFNFNGLIYIWRCDKRYNERQAPYKWSILRMLLRYNGQKMIMKKTNKKTNPSWNQSVLFQITAVETMGKIGVCSVFFSRRFSNSILFIAFELKPMKRCCCCWRFHVCLPKWIQTRGNLPFGFFFASFRLWVDCSHKI